MDIALLLDIKCGSQISKFDISQFNKLDRNDISAFLPDYHRLTDFILFFFILYVVTTSNTWTLSVLMTMSRM